jgi:hypothetical protein
MDSAKFGTLLNDLVEVTDIVDVDLTTDCGRWQLYEKAMATSAGRDLVYLAVGLEPDEPLASAAVVRAVETVADDQRPKWISRLPEGNRDYATRRAHELSLFEKLAAGEINDVEVAGEVDSWTDWLQSRIAQASDSCGILAIMERRGRTKRIRNQAKQRSAQLRCL